MIIGFDTSLTGNGKAGTGYFAAGLIGGLADVDSGNLYLLYPSFGDGVWDGNWPRTRPLLERPNVRRGLGHRTRRELDTFWRTDPLDERALGDPDVIHSNNFYCPVRLRTARIVYTLYDLSFLEHPEWTTEGNRRTCLSGVLNASVHADRIIAISKYTQQHFVREFPHFPAERVSVVYPASRFPQALAGRPSRAVQRLSPGGFWLSVATLEPRKNHVRLLAAYARLKQTCLSAPPLVLVGGKGWLMDGLSAELSRRGLRKDVLLLGYVDDASLQWLYENCFGFAYVSLLEGFGMPVLEAMSCGAAVITSNTTSLPEVTGDAAISVDPYDTDAIYSAMLSVQRGEVDRSVLRQRSYARAAQFSWTKTALEVKSIYELLHEAGGCAVPLSK
jgi:glycosyltransferase involved in cell wall biosynthesis